MTCNNSGTLRTLRFLYRPYLEHTIQQPPAIHAQISLDSICYIMPHNAYQVLTSDGDMQGWEGGKRAADGRCLGLGRLRRASGTVTGPGELLLGASDVG